MKEIIIDKSLRCECRIAWERIAAATSHGEISRFFLPKQKYNPENDRKIMGLDEALGRIFSCDCYICQCLAARVKSDLEEDGSVDIIVV